jgi:hypothetical protein
VRDEQRGDGQLGLDPPDLLAQLHPHLRVQRGQRLVEQQHPRPDRQRPRERDPLLLTAGHLVRVLAGLVASPTSSSSSPARVRSSLPETLRRRSPKPTLSRAVRLGNRLYAWKTIPMSRLLAGTRVMSSPPTSTRPASAVSRPARIRSAVVLPQPDGPSSETNSPGLDEQVEARPAPRHRVRPRQRLEVDAGTGGHALPPARGPSCGPDELGQGQEQAEGEQQGSQRHRDRQRRVPLAGEVDGDLQGREVQQAGQRELAEDEGDRQERRRQHRCPARPAGPRGA